MSFRKEGVFNLWREEVLTIKPEYEERDEYVPDLVKFCWTMKVTRISEKKNKII